MTVICSHEYGEAHWRSDSAIRCDQPSVFEVQSPTDDDFWYGTCALHLSCTLWAYAEEARSLGRTLKVRCLGEIPSEDPCLEAYREWERLTAGGEPQDE